MPQTTEIELQQDAGDQHDALAYRIAHIARQCAPLVQEYTGLTLPPRLVIRLLTAPQWRRVARQAQARVVAAEVAQLKPARGRVRAARLGLRLMRPGLWVMWMLCGPRTIIGPDGESQIVFAPDSLRHAGQYEDDDQLHLMFAHELIHPAQHRAGTGRFATLSATPFTLERGIADRVIAPVCEGHATWASQRIAAKLLGHQPQDSTGELASEAFRKRAEAYARTGHRQGTYDDGSQFIAQVIDGTEEYAGLGVESFNRVWTQPDLLPTTAEFTHPEEWIVRVRDQRPPAEQA